MWISLFTFLCLSPCTHHWDCWLEVKGSRINKLLVKPSLQCSGLLSTGLKCIRKQCSYDPAYLTFKLHVLYVEGSAAVLRKGWSSAVFHYTLLVLDTSNTLMLWTPYQLVLFHLPKAGLCFSICPRGFALISFLERHSPGMLGSVPSAGLSFGQRSSSLKQ